MGKCPTNALPMTNDRGPIVLKRSSLVIGGALVGHSSLMPVGHS
jgi:hypothetical protein